MAVYIIKNRTTGLCSTGGCFPKFVPVEHAMLYRTKSSLSHHVDIASASNPSVYTDCDIIEVLITETNTTTPASTYIQGLRARRKAR